MYELALADAEHAAYARTRFDVWVGREEDLEALDAHAADPLCPPLVVTGESGTGKSALVANWLRRLTAAEPLRPVLAHYAGASPRSADWPHVAVRLIRTLDRRLGLGLSPPTDPAELPAALARALALRPEVLLLDEPCSALDPLASRVVEQLIASLRGRYTVVIVTHNLAQARRLADSVTVFWVEGGAGAVIEHGPADQVFEDPLHPLTRTYVSGELG